MYRPRWMLSVFLICTTLFLSWIWPVTRTGWDAIDRAIFIHLNQWIESPFWQWFWALSNHPVMDWVLDGIMVVFFLHYIFKTKTALLQRVAKVLFSILVGALIILGINRGVFRKYVNINRESPSIVVEKSVKLSEYIHAIHVKDRSRDCYPADHATTAIIFFMISCLHMSPRTRVLSFFNTCYFCLPRLIVGAHWLTDIVMGSMMISLIPLSWVYGTPLAKIGETTIEKLITRRKIGQTP